MNPTPALVAAFVARLDRVLDRVASTDGAMVLVQPFDGARDPGSPWPVDLPLPLTVADARAAVARDRGRIAAEHAANIVRLVAALIPVEWQAGALEDPAVVAAWPWYMGETALHHLTDTWAALTDQPGGAPPARWWSAGAWARSRRSDIGGTPGFHTIASATKDGLRWHLAGVDALYRHMVSRSPLFCAVEAGRLVRELGAPVDPGPSHFAAVRDVLGKLAHPDKGDPDALALAAFENGPRLSGYAAELLDAGRKVAALFAVDPVDEDAARATVETPPHGPALRWDVAFAAELDRLGGARADTVRKNAAARWAAVYGPQVPIPDTPRPAPGSLWGLWLEDLYDPGGTSTWLHTPLPLWLRVLTRELWVSKWKPALEQEPAEKHPSVAMPALFALFAIRGPDPVARTWSDEGRELAELRGGSGHLDMAGIPAPVAERLLSGDLGILRSRAGMAVLDLLVRSLTAELRQRPYDARRVPKIAIPAGRALAIACGMPCKGTTARDLDEAVQAWAAVVLKGPRQAEYRFLLSPERCAPAPGQAGAWLLVPGELLLPTALTADTSKQAKAWALPRAERPWRRLVPWPDVRAPDDYARDRDRADADALALAMVLTWTEHATADHGRTWLDRPGMNADDAGWGTLVDRAHADALRPLRGRAIDALAGAQWVTVNGDRVAPGPALPGLTVTLNAAALKARENGKRKAKKHP